MILVLAILGFTPSYQAAYSGKMTLHWFAHVYGAIMTSWTGATIFFVAHLAISLTWGSPAWHQFWFNRLAPFVEQVVEVKLSNEQIDPLLGEYGDDNWRMRVFRENGKIYLQLPDVPKFEMAPSSENEWFLRTMTWKVSFIRNPDGSVLKLVNKQPRVTGEKQRFRER